jgi:uncharacterized protein YcbK (DUF882 family)
MIQFWNKSRPDFWVSSNFKISEFACKCGKDYCGYAIIDTETIIVVQRVRDLTAQSCTITSGYRCPEHNKAEGGSTFSRHIVGLAADITWKSAYKDLADPVFRSHIKSIYEGGNTKLMGIGWGKTFLHVDTDIARKTLTEWKY